MTVPGYGGWHPVTEVRVDTVTPAAAGRLHHLLDAPGAAPAAGDDLPALWHWLAFLPDARQSELGSDGHPARGGFLPPVELPRRMFVGGRLERTGPLHVGETLTRTGAVSAIDVKDGRSGRLVFVTVRYEVAGEAGVALVEEQDLVYREAAAPSSAPAAPAPATPPPVSEAPAWPWRLDVAVDPTLLFRFSALTYNAHRIHYDRAWATREEGYPGLVVHGPLQAIAMAELCRRHRPGVAVTDLSFRAVRPAFDDGPLALCGRPDPDGPGGPGATVSLAAVDHHGAATATATARLASTGRPTG